MSTREREPVLAGVERADAVGELLGQHRQHAVDEVDARRAQPRLVVDRRVPRHVVAHVGDVHAEKHAPVLGALDADRVVEVARVDRVDGEGEAVADVSAVGLARERLLDVDAQRLGLARATSSGNSVRRPCSRMMISISMPGSPSRPTISSTKPCAEWLRDGIAGEPHDDDVAGRRLADRVRGDEDVVADAAVGRRDDADGAVPCRSGRRRWCSRARRSA